MRLAKKKKQENPSKRYIHILQEGHFKQSLSPRRQDASRMFVSAAGNPVRTYLNWPRGGSVDSGRHFREKQKRGNNNRELGLATELHWFPTERWVGWWIVLL